MADLHLLVISLSCVLFLLLLRLPYARYPPGPNGLPFVGIVRRRPTSEPWKIYAQWGKEYGDEGIISFRLLRRRIVVINSREVAEDLLVKRGTVYSDRPFPVMSGHLMRREKSIFLLSYNERLRKYRRLMHSSFNLRASERYWPLQGRATHSLLDDLLHAPRGLRDHLKRFSGSVILSIAYGYPMEGKNDHLINLAEDSMHLASIAGTPGRWLVDSFPPLRFLPSWLPGAGFKRQARKWGDQLYTQSVEPYEYVKREMAAGKAIPSFTSELLSAEGSFPDPELEDLVLWTAGALYAAGADTTASAIYTFFYVMTRHPEIQRRAQAEIDAIIGLDRLPTFADRNSLSYVDCVIKEVLRWHPPVPLALPHMTNMHDTYCGYAIPKGSYVIVNLWAMLHEEEVYPNPMTFDPARFEGAKPQPDPREIVFGRGRRLCPGQHVAEASIFIQIASVLATFDVRRAVDAMGREIEPELDFTNAAVSFIKPFRCCITPRSARARTLIEQALTLDVS